MIEKTQGNSEIAGDFARPERKIEIEFEEFAGFLVETAQSEGTIPHQKILNYLSRAGERE